MFRTALRSLLLAVVFVSPAWAGSQPGVYSGGSKHYGKTIVSVPGTYYSVKVDAAGKVTPLAGSRITVAHDETGAGCHKVSTVSATFETAGAISAVAPTPKQVSPNACSFAAPSATFTVAYPLTAVKAEEDYALRKACLQRPAGTTRILVPLPLLLGFKVTLEYAAGGVDDISYPIPMVSVSCESLALESASATPTSLGPGGGAVKLEGKISSPVVTITSVRARLNTAGKLTSVPLSLASGAGANGIWSGAFQAPGNTSSSSVRYEVTFEATDDKGSTTILAPATPVRFVVSAYKAPVLPTSTAKPAPTLPH